MLTGIEFVIFDGTPFVINEKPGFQSRNMAAKLLIFELAHTGMLGRMNAHFTIHTADSPVSPLPELCEVPFAGPWNDSCTQPRAPLNGAVLSHNRRAGFGDMLWPTWAFVGWPELHQPPHDFWPTKYQALLAAGAAAPWEARSNKALFAGTLLGGAQRKRAAEIAQDEASNLLVVHNMSNEEQCRHKYLLYLEGGSFIQCFSSRADYIFLCGSAVLFPIHPQLGPWQEWFFPAFKPFVHYIPVANDLSDLTDKIQLLRSNDTLAREIGAAGKALAEELLSPQNALCYMRDLLLEYERRQTFEVTFPRDNGTDYLSSKLLQKQGT